MNNFILNKILYIMVGRFVSKYSRRTVWNGIRLAKFLFRFARVKF